MPKPSGSSHISTVTAEPAPSKNGHGRWIPNGNGAAIQFPARFMWGVATSAFQDEGGAGLTDWDEFKPYRKTAPKHPGFTEDDLDLANELEIQSIRFSVEWARVEPTQGNWDEDELVRVRKHVRAMKKRGIEPFINLYHFTLPAWVAKRGGWENDSVPHWFAQYAQRVATALRKERVRWWMTMNEPSVVVSEGYLNGNFPPALKTDMERGLHARQNLVDAHFGAYDALHRVLDRPTQKFKVMVGIAHAADYYMPENPKDGGDRNATASVSFLASEQFIGAVRGAMDYVGINYYKRSVIKFSIWGALGYLHIPVGFVNSDDRDFGIYPEGLYQLIHKYARFGKPILVTENGIEDAADKKRPAFIAEHLRVVARAAGELAGTKSPVLGYFYWTFHDNFEWNRYTLSQFGLVGVDPKTNERFIRPSALLYRDIIRSNAVPDTLPKSRE